MGRAHTIGPVPRVLASLLLAALGALPARAAASDAAYLEELKQAARELHLADAREWRILGHYAAHRFRPGAASEADSPEFFLSPDGKNDPQAELDATLAAFFEPAEARIRLDDHPQCAYPARREWLDARLGFDRTRFPWRECAALDEWIAGLGARGLTLVFAEAFMNNPSSTFGHTLLRVDGRPATDPGGAPSDRAGRDLLSYSVNFAGETGTDSGALYAVKGIFGAYNGFFSLLPYYDKINQYVRWESRAIWEYELDFTPDEVRRLLFHLWELRDVAFAYFFFSENCSYQLLGLLEAARPGLDLSGGYAGWVIPIDTVRSIVEQAGISDRVVYRPSAVEKIRHMGAALGPEERRIAAALSDGNLAPDADAVQALPAPTRTTTLAVAADKVSYEAGKGDAAARKRLLGLLRARSRTGVKGDPVAPPEPPAVRPDEGHGSSRLRVAGGAVDGRSFVELRWRPATHDLLDPQGGFLEGAAINFIDTAVRYHPDDGEFDLHELAVIDIESLAPRDELFEPISWHLKTGLATRRMPSGVVDELREAKLFHNEVGAGMTLRPWRNALVYGFLDGALDVSGKLDDHYAIGAGASAGIYVSDPSDRWRGHLFAKATRYFAGDTRSAFQVGLEQRVRITRNHALRLHVTGERDFRETWLDVGLGWDFYF